MADTWYENLGFDENPFTIKPALSSRLHGYVKEKKEAFVVFNLRVFRNNYRSSTQSI